MEEVKLVINGMEIIFGSKDDLPCANCHLSPKGLRESTKYDSACGDGRGEEFDVVYGLCISLDNSYRVIGYREIAKTAHAPTATLNYPCGSIGEEIE